MVINILCDYFVSSIKSLHFFIFLITTDEEDSGFTFGYNFFGISLAFAIDHTQLVHP